MIPMLSLQQFEPVRPTATMAQPAKYSGHDQAANRNVWKAAGAQNLHRHGWKPSATLALIDPNFDETCRGHIFMPFADLMDAPQMGCESTAVIRELAQHMSWLNRFLVVIAQAATLHNIVD
jgi:hypothetical protein